MKIEDFEKIENCEEKLAVASLFSAFYVETKTSEAKGDQNVELHSETLTTSKRTLRNKCIACGHKNPLKDCALNTVNL